MSNVQILFYREEAMLLPHQEVRHSLNCCCGFFHLCSRWLISWRLFYLAVQTNLEEHTILLHREQTTPHSHNHQSKSLILCFPHVNSWTVLFRKYFVITISSIFSYDLLLECLVKCWEEFKNWSPLETTFVPWLNPRLNSQLSHNVRHAEIENYQFQKFSLLFPMY